MRLKLLFPLLTVVALASCGTDLTKFKKTTPAVTPTLKIVSLDVSGSPVRKQGTITLKADIATSSITDATFKWTVGKGWGISGAATGPTVVIKAPNGYEVAGSATLEVTVAVPGTAELKAEASANFETRAYQLPEVTEAAIAPEIIVSVADLDADPDDVNDLDVAYTWIIGGLEVATGENATWTNPGMPGVYEASLRAVDSKGAIATKTFTLNIGSTSPWPTAGRTLQHTGRQDQGTLQPAGTLGWTYYGPGVQNSPVIGADGRIFVGSWDNGFGGGVSAMTAAGTKAWSYDVTASAFGSLDNYGAPALSSDGYLYHAPWHGSLSKLNAATGELVWEYFTGTNFDNESPKIGADGTIFTSTELGVLAVRSNGTLRWYFEPGTTFSNNIAIGQDGTIYAFDNGGPHSVFALSPATGDLLWAYPVTGSMQYGSFAVNSQGKIVVASSGWVTQINRNGTLDWAVNRGSSCNKGIALGADDTIYYVNSAGVLNAVMSTGAERWTLDIGSGGNSTPSVGSDGTIYAADNTSMTAVNPNGARKWWLGLGDASESQPAIGNNGVIYLGLNDSVVAIE